MQAFKASRAVKPTAWKVRFLRRLVREERANCVSACGQREAPGPSVIHAVVGPCLRGPSRNHRAPASEVASHSEADLFLADLNNGCDQATKAWCKKALPFPAM